MEHICNTPKYWRVRKTKKGAYLDIGWNTVKINFCPFCGKKLKGVK